MPIRMRFIDVAYYYNRTTRPELLLEAHRANLGYFDFLPQNWHCSLIKFADGEGHIPRERFDYHYFQGRGSRLWWPLKANRFIGRQQPQVVMVHGLIFPWQLLLLRRQLDKHAKIIVQHHADVPGKGIMRWLQRRANRCVDAYLFAAEALSEPWVQQGIIEKEKVFQVMEGSTDLPELDKHTARHYLQLPGGPVFLWVGRLNANKDPLTVLRGFSKFLREQPAAKLYMVYQDEELLNDVQQLVNSDALLRSSVILKGRMDKKELAYWYNAADFYISGSHSEGSGYALIEAMCCGCVPLVTDIPSFRHITSNGDAGFLFKRGDADSLLETLRRAMQVNVHEFSLKAKEQFQRELSFKAIARQLCRVCEAIK